MPTLLGRVATWTSHREAVCSAPPTMPSRLASACRCGTAIKVTRDQMKSAFPSSRSVADSRLWGDVSYSTSTERHFTSNQLVLLSLTSPEITLRCMSRMLVCSDFHVRTTETRRRFQRSQFTFRTNVEFDEFCRILPGWTKAAANGGFREFHTNFVQSQYTERLFTVVSLLSLRLILCSSPK